MNGAAQVTENKDNQWKITLPLQVVYQNDKEKVTQLLQVDLTVGRKPSGDLGITQMIATPRTLDNTMQNNAKAVDENAVSNDGAPTVTPNLPTTTPAHSTDSEAVTTQSTSPGASPVPSTN